MGIFLHQIIKQHLFISFYLYLYCQTRAFCYTVGKNKEEKNRKRRTHVNSSRSSMTVWLPERPRFIDGDGPKGVFMWNRATLILRAFRSVEPFCLSLHWSFIWFPEGTFLFAIWAVADADKSWRLCVSVNGVCFCILTHTGAGYSYKGSCPTSITRKVAN